MEIRNYKEVDRASTGVTYWNHFDINDLDTARKQGYSDAQIGQWLQSSGYGIDKQGDLRIGAEAWKSLGGSFGTSSSSSLPRSSTPSSSAASAPPSSSSAPDNSAQLLAYQRELDTYRNEASANSFKLADYESQLNRYKADLETSKTQYADVLGKYNESTQKISSLGQDLEKVKADAELNRSNLEAYKKDTITQQLDVLRRGTNTSQGPSSGQADLTSGGTAVTRAPRQGGVNVVAEVDATDSVLDRKGPVVDVMGGGSSARSSRVDARQRALAASRGGSAAGYYASRFG